jgi:hypothetical protein
MNGVTIFHEAFRKLYDKAQWKIGVKTLNFPVTSIMDGHPNKI